MKLSFFLQAAFLVSLYSVTTAGPRPQALYKPCGKPADIVFIIDNSNSIWIYNYQKFVVPFVKTLVDLFDIGPGPEQTRVGVISYGDDVKLQFHLDEHLDKTSMTKAIGDIRHKYMGSTFTDKALRFAVDSMFQPEFGSRSDIAHIIVLITDGESSNAKATRDAVHSAKENGIAIFALGVGDKVDDEELKIIASEPTDKYKFRVDDYGALDSIKEDLALRTCEVTVPPTTAPPTTTPVPTTTFEPVPECGLEPADIFFVLDSSTSIMREDFEKRVLTFLKDVVSEFNISPQRVRVGVMTFSTKPQLVIALDDYTDKYSLLDAINPDIVKYTRGGTNTASALRDVRTMGFEASPRGKQVTKIAVVITDGRSWYRHETKQEARKLRQAGVTVYAIGVGRGVHKEELEEMASNPKEDYVFSVPDFQALAQIKDKLIGKSCPTPEIQKDIFVCGSSPIDITVAFDPTTRTLTQTKQVFEQIRFMNHRMIELRGQIRTSVASGDCPPNLDIPLSDPTESNVILKDLEHYIQPSMQRIVKRWRVDMKESSRTDWLVAQKDRVLVLILNQENTPEFERLAEELLGLKEDGTNVFVVLETGVDKRHIDFWLKTLGGRQVLEDVKPGEDFSGHLMEFICAV